MRNGLRGFFLRFFMALLSVALVACGGGGGSSPEPSPDTSLKTPANAPPANAIPAAVAGADQNVTEGSEVSLDGSSCSDEDGDLLIYRWELLLQPEGSSAALSNPAVVNPVFTADKEGSYLLGLTVNDGTDDSDPAYVIVTAASGNSAPMADAGTNQNVTTGSEVSLDGSVSSDADSDTLSYSWAIVSLPTGSATELSDPAVVNPTFTADADGSYVLSLTVNDGAVDSGAAYITVTAASGNSAPMADAGIYQNVTTGSEVSLDGSASSDSDSDALSYNWAIVSLPAGSATELSDSAVVNPAFTLDADGTYVFSLTVNDGAADSAPAYVTVTAASGNSAPMADAGSNQNITTGSQVALNAGASSDADSDALSYNWSIVSLPAGSAAALSDPGLVNPTFTADADGSYVLSLTVSDGATDSAPAYVTVTAASGNSAPVADAGSPLKIAIGREVTLDGSASTDADGDALSYSWSFVSKPQYSYATLSDASAVNPTFTADWKGSYVLRLVVSDGEADSAAATVTVTTGNEWRFRGGLESDLWGLDLSYISLVATEIVRSDLSGADLTGANLYLVILRDSNISKITWADTICSDGTNSDDNGGTCEGHMYEW